jgi:CheY-like chemotaxis protein
MSHELRTPLNPIIGFADLLGDAPNLTEEQRQFTHMIRQRSTDLLQLINDILDLSKIDADAVPITPEAVPLRPFLADLVRVTEPLARDKGLAFSWHVDPAAPDVIMADPLRLRQVLLNLLSNAVKFTPNGAVTLQVENSPAPLATPGSTGLRFSVRDTGIGLASENLQDLFKPFVQADMSFTRRFGGAGLGLAIARRLVQKMGGDIGVESKEGQGSVFHFTLRFPAREAPPASALPASAAPIQNSGRNRRVLLIEDDVSNRFLVEIILRKAGYECEAAEDGEEGLRRFEEKPPDLVLLDIQLPRMNGLEVTARIRELDQAAGRHTPIVAITAYAMRGDRERFLAAGMDAYVAKPIQTAALLAAMNAVLSGTSAAPAQSEKTS